MRTIGIDLAIVGDHKAVILDDQGNPLGKVFRLQTDEASLEALLCRAREGAGEDEPLRAVMEPTGLAWLPAASYLIQRGVTVYLVNTQQVADLRRFYKKHACQAVCACATHLLDRVRAVLRDGRPYELRDVDGRPITWQEARAIIAERYHVPDEVRKRNSKRARKAQQDRRAERKQKRRSRPGR
ncbi:MAG: transposase [Anaerolineae bacterium]|nr:transposase [Anaerolineae bacterium]